MLGFLGNCPAVDIDNNICMLNGQEVACNLIRECDGQTGAQHFEYAMPFGNPNVNIWVLGPDGNFTWSGPDDPPGPPPSRPAGMQPAFAEGDGYYQPTEPQSAVWPTAPTNYSAPPASPVIQTPAVQVIREAAPPPGTFTFDAEPGVITPQLGPAPSGTTTPSGSAVPAQAIILDDLTSGLPIPSSLKKEIGGIPIWALLAAAVAAYLMFGDKR